MVTRLENYLRLHRLRHAFTQEELSFLLGYRAQSMGSLFERQKRRMTLANAFSYQLIFDADPRELFPALFAQAQGDVIHRMRELEKRLAVQKTTAMNGIKLRLLRKALVRLTARQDE